MEKNQTPFPYPLENGVFVSPGTREKFKAFEQSYLSLRTKEKRVLSIEEIRSLPYPKKGSPDYDLWAIRRKNIHRFLRYLNASGKKQRILDIGCGNGFFTHLMAQQQHEVHGVDVNAEELEQAACAFPEAGISWFCIDILNETPDQRTYDLITFCTSFQYFKDAGLVLNRCLSLLNPGGEIHIIDSPFYDETTVSIAKNKSHLHFKKLEVPDMTQYYYHHTFSSLNQFHITFGYRSRSLLSRLIRLKDSPFPWIIVKQA